MLAATVMLQRMMRLLHVALFLGLGGIIVELSLKIHKADSYHWLVLIVMRCSVRAGCQPCLYKQVVASSECFCRLRSSTTPIINCVRELAG